MKKKKWLAMLLAVAMVFTIISTTVFAVGNGEWGSDYDTATEFTISNEEELRAFSAMVNEGKDFAGKTVKLANSIAMSDTNWVPIGSNESVPFAGIFNGQSNTISGLNAQGYVDEDIYDFAYYAVGMFGYLSGTVENLILEDVSITGPRSYSGGVAGYLIDGASISYCNVSGSISGGQYGGETYSDCMGGIAGTTANFCERITITNCASDVSIDGHDYVGGIIGYVDADNVCIENCTHNGAVSGSAYVGGIIGEFNGDSKSNTIVKNCMNKGAVSGKGYVGGIVGKASDILVSGCKNEGVVTGDYNENDRENRAIGGVVGNVVSTAIENCENTADVTAPQLSWVGGIAGRLHQGSSVNGCTNNGDIQGGDRTGGIVGYADAYADGYQVDGCANTGSVSGANAVGGIVGHTSASNRENANISVTDCTNSGAVSGDSAVGGIVGDHSSSFAIGANNVQTSATVSNCINTGSVPAGAGAIVGNNNTNNDQAGKVESNFWPESVGLNAVGSGAGSAGESSNEVNNNSSYDKDGNFNSPVVGNDGIEIPNLSGSCEEFFGGHDYGEEWTTDKEATCTEAGSKHKVCNRCGTKGEITEIPALGHNAVKTEAKAATCTKDGNITYWYCDVCKKYFSDEALTTEITKDKTVVKATGHSETELKNAKDATCTEEGYTGDKVCMVCGEVVEQGKAIPKLAHSYKDGKCTVCGAADPNYKPTEPGDGDTNVPETGDSSNMTLWIALLFVSGTGLFGATAYSRKKRAR